MAAIHVPTTRNLVDEITGAKHVSIKAPGSLPAKWRTRRSAFVQGEGPIPQWRAMVPRGRNPDHATQKTDATERVPPWKNQWRAMLCHGRNSCAGNPEPCGRDHRRKACVHKGTRFPAGQMADATERVCPRRGANPAMEGHGPSWPESQQRHQKTDATERVFPSAPSPGPVRRTLRSRVHRGIPAREE